MSKLFRPIIMLEAAAYTRVYHKMSNNLEMRNFHVDELQWIKLQLRLAALEHSGPKLSYKFSFATDLSEIVCRIYFREDDSNPMSALSPNEQKKVQDGWIELTTGQMVETLRLCGLPPSFTLNSRVRYILQVSSGMGSRITREAEGHLTW